MIYWNLYILIWNIYENRCKDGKIHGELHYNKKREEGQNSIRVIVIRR